MSFNGHRGAPRHIRARLQAGGPGDLTYLRFVDSGLEGSHQCQAPNCADNAIAGSYHARHAPGYRVRRRRPCPGALAEPVGGHREDFRHQRCRLTMRGELTGELRGTIRPGPEGEKWVIAVSRSYIAPAILTRARGLELGDDRHCGCGSSAMVSSTFFRATASTKP